MDPRGDPARRTYEAACYLELSAAFGKGKEHQGASDSLGRAHTCTEVREYVNPGMGNPVVKGIHASPVLVVSTQHDNVFRLS
jgi:hypothetical protein